VQAGTPNASVETRSDQRTYDDFDRLFNRTDSFNRQIRYGYDLNGNRTSLTDSDGIVTSYSFDGLNRAVNVTTQQGVTTYQYDRSSLIAQVRYPNNTQASYEYDQAIRKTRVHNQQNNATVSNFTYVYDDNGNRTEQRETNGGPEELTTYNYDINDRLEEVVYRQGSDTQETVTYTYDAAYNRASEVTKDQNNATTEDKTYRYNARNQLTNVDDNLDANNSAAYQFDLNGNQIHKTHQLIGVRSFLCLYANAIERKITPDGVRILVIVKVYVSLRVGDTSDCKGVRLAEGRGCQC